MAPTRTVATSIKRGVLYVLVETGDTEVRLICPDRMSQLNWVAYLQPRIERDIVRDEQHRRALQQQQKKQQNSSDEAAGEEDRSQHARDLLATSTLQSGQSESCMNFSPMRPMAASPVAASSRPSAVATEVSSSMFTIDHQGASPKQTAKLSQQIFDCSVSEELNTWV